VCEDKCVSMHSSGLLIIQSSFCYTGFQKESLKCIDYSTDLYEFTLPGKWQASFYQAFLGNTSQFDNLPSEIPNLVIENGRIRNYSLSILVMMPCPYCMCMVFYVKTVHGHSLLPGMLNSLVEVL
jgi:hypothetical protein